jgi:integrase
MMLWAGIDPRSSPAGRRRKAPAVVVVSEPITGSRALADVAAQYIRDHTCGGEAAWKEGTVRSYVSAINMFLAWAGDAGVVTVDQLDAKALGRFRAHVLAAPRRTKQRGACRKGVADTTHRKSASAINRPFRSIATMLQKLRAAGEISLSRDAIKDNLKQVPIKQVKPDPLMPEQIRQLLAACRKYDDEWEPPIGPFVIFMLLTGMRLGEAMNLTWADVNIREQTIRVIAENKTGTERTVDMRVSPALVRLLTTMRGDKLGHKRVFEQTKATAKDARKYLIEKCGAPPFLWSTQHSRSGGKRSVPNLRSTCSSYLASAPGIYGGASAKRSAEQLGHSITIAEKHYLGALRSIPKKARTLEAAMEIAAELNRLLAVGRRSRRAAAA